MLRNKRLWSILLGVFAFFFAIMITVTFFTTSYASMINKELGVSTNKVIKGENSENEDTEYFKSKFLKPDGTRDDAALDKWQKDLCEQIEAEGAVLVENKQNALPIAKTSGVTFFGRSSADVIYGGTGSGQVNVNAAATMQSAFTAAGITKINTDLLDWYKARVQELKDAKKDRGVAGMWQSYETVGDVTRIAEIPVDTLKTSGVSYDGYKDVAIITIGRSGGEGSDLPTGKFTDGEAYFELQEEEKKLLEYVETLGFGKTIVLINSSNAMALDWLDDPAYGIDGCLWIGGPGTHGLNAVAKILCGDINPSGRFVDTYSASSLSSASIQNTGGYTFSNATEDGSAAIVGGVTIDGVPGDRTGGRYGTHYLVEKEGIYVGYKYYETRYEDIVLGRGNADGNAGIFASKGNNWSYSDEVDYPFGYGLSYSTYEQKLEGVEFDRKSDTFTVSVSVKNNGARAGKCTVQVYGQQPYTDFDKTNKIEKSAIQLVGFGKTKELQPGASETVKVEVERKTLVSYDSKVNKTYILEAGDYYLSVGDNAHDALNNILAVKGKTTANGMDYNGKAELTYKFNVADTDNTSYAYSEANTGVKITNRFDSADLNYYGDNMVTYLTRSDWQGTFPTSYDVLEATPKMIQDLQFNYTPDTGKSDIKTGSTATAYTIVMMRGVEYDSEIWDDILDQLTLEEMAEIVGHCGYSTPAIASISLPATKHADGPQGIKGTYLNGESTMAYTSEPVMAATFNTDILYDIGLSMGEDGLRIAGTNKVSGWYGPAMNIHRTPYSGRNFEYYSEDGFLSGIMAAKEVAAAQSMGLCCYIKHFALNDFETYRQSVATFATEQAIREIFLKGFQYAVEDGGATAVMSSFNRIGCRWAGAHKGLLTDVLRNEWGFVGVVHTDAVMANRNWMDVAIGIEAGNDTWLSSGDWLVPKIQEWAKADAKFMKNLRQSCKNFLYSYVNSTVINGISSADKVVSVMPGWQIAVTVVDVLLGVFAAAALAMYVVACVLIAKDEKKEA